MTPVLVRDAEALHEALASDTNIVHVSLSRETAQLVADWVDARVRGQEVIVTLGLKEISPGDAAAMMGMSRAQVRKLMDDGVLPFRLVGSHHRIRLDAVRKWLDIEDARQGVAMAELMSLQNELGLID